jgi:tetratricopeptide (TPR) repeat protein
VLHWTPGADGTPWAAVLLARARAHAANALRVAGDLPKADAELRSLRRDLARAPLEDTEANGEIASLEASLRLDQRRFEEAGELLDRAALLMHHARTPEGEARVLIQRAGLLHQTGDDEAAEASLREAVALLDPDLHGQTLLYAVTSHTLSLCNLGRFDEADRVLDDQLPAFEKVTDPWTALLLRGLRGRVALGRGDHKSARESFTAVCEGALALGRELDAAMAALDLAEVALAAGDHRELARIAAVLVPSFEARGVSRETMAALTLLRRAIAAESVTAATLASVRKRLETQRDR